MSKWTTRSTRSPPVSGVATPLDGSQGSPQAWKETENRRIKIRPSQKAGTAKPATDSAVKKWSILLPRRSAPVTPSGIEITTPSRIAVTVSSSVLGRRSQMWARTGLPSIIDRPKSPWSSPVPTLEAPPRTPASPAVLKKKAIPIQSRYWTYHGRSSPRFARIRAMSSGRRLGLKSSPGTTLPWVKWMRRKVTSVTPNTTGIAASPIRTAYFAIGQPSVGLLAVGDERVLHPGPVAELRVGAQALVAAGESLDPLIDSVNALAEGQDGCRRLLVECVLQLVVELLALVLVQGANGVVEDLVHCRAFVDAAV